jgi:hypothetical protein
MYTYYMCSFTASAISLELLIWLFPAEKPNQNAKKASPRDAFNFEMLNL